MATTQADVQAAEQKLEQAFQALQAAQAEEARLVNDPAARAMGTYDAAKTKTQQARDAVSFARDQRNQVRNQYNRENPASANKPPSESERLRKSENDQREKNLREIGLPITDKERDAREQRQQPRPARTDSPAQTTQATTGVVNANTAQGNLAERVRHNQQTEQQAIVNAQKDALYKAGILFKDIRNQVSQEAQAGVAAQQKNIAEVSTAGRALLEKDVQQRRQDIDYTKARADFIGTTLNTAMPKVLELMLKTPKGSKIAANFLKAYLTLANDAYKAAGLEKTPPPIDMTSPHMQNLLKIGGYQLPAQLPELPTSSQVSFEAAKASAVGSFPVYGWQGPVGIEATQIPDMPRGTNGDGVNIYKQAEQSPEGQAIVTEVRQRIAAIEAKEQAGQPLTAEEQAQKTAALEEAKARIRSLAEQQRAAPQQSAQPGAPEDLKGQIRAALVSGDPNQRLRIMATAQAAVENQAQGLPLTDDQSALLANLDQADLAIIQQNMTPDVAQILLKFKNGQQPTPEEIARVQTAVAGTTAGIKNRPLTQPTQAERRPPVDINVAQAQQIEHEVKNKVAERLKQNEAELAQPTGDPELDAMMAQINQEHIAYAQSNPERTDIYFGRSLREQAEAELRKKRQTQQATVAPEPPQLGLPEFVTPDGRFGIPAGRLGATDTQGSTQAEPEMPRLLSDLTPEPTIPPTDMVNQDLSQSLEMPRLLAPMFAQREDEEQPRSLFDDHYNWGY